MPLTGERTTFFTVLLGGKEALETNYFPTMVAGFSSRQPAEAIRKNGEDGGVVVNF